MDAVHWSDSQLRNYIEAEASLGFFDDKSDREIARAKFRVELRSIVVPVVQARLLETIGVLVDPEGLTMVCYDLVDDLGYKHQIRRWVLVTPSRWAYLAEWIGEEVVKSYKLTAGRKRPNGKVLKEIERANQ